MHLYIHNEKKERENGRKRATRKNKAGESTLKLSIYDNEVMLMTRHSRFYAHGMRFFRRVAFVKKFTLTHTHIVCTSPSFSPRKIYDAVDRLCW